MTGKWQISSRWRRWLAVLGAVAAGCSVLPKPAPPPKSHDFGPLDGPVAEAPARLSITQITAGAPGWVQSTKIHYRRLAQEPTRLQHYAQNQWVAPPTDLLRQWLEQALTPAGGDAQDVAEAAAAAEAAMTPGGDRARSGLMLQVELEQFEQQFTADGQAYAVIQLRGELRESPSGPPLARHVFRARRKTSADVQGAVKALSGLAREGVGDLSRWLAQSEELARR